MSEWALEWVVVDQEQCWWDIFQVWNSDGFRVALCHMQIELAIEATTEGQLTSENLEIAYQPIGPYFQIHGWTSQWMQ